MLQDTEEREGYNHSFHKKLAQIWNWYCRNLLNSVPGNKFRPHFARHMRWHFSIFLLRATIIGNCTYVKPSSCGTWSLPRSRKEKSRFVFLFTFTGFKETYGDLVHISMLLITHKHKLRIQIILHLARHFVFNFLGITIFLTFACQPFVEYRTFGSVHISNCAI